MKIVIKNTIGQSEYTFQIEEVDDIEALIKASFYGHPFKKCGLCESDDLFLEGRKAKGFSFVSVKCNHCGATSSMGQYKDGKGFFWKAFERYVAQGEA
jgi:translation initiation factor 2 beta subunit (eIF-2beta)/eIF-5